MMPTSPPQELDDVQRIMMSSAVNYSTPSPLPLPPPPPPDQLVEYSSWTSGLCDCFSDIHSCCLVFCCPCIAFGRIANIVDKGTSSCCACGSLYVFLIFVDMALSAIASLALRQLVSQGPVGFQWILSCVYRGKLKQNLNIRPSCMEDCCYHFWCEPCALCQEYRELQNRGYDLSLGWEENMWKLNATSTNHAEVLPPAFPNMNR